MSCAWIGSFAILSLYMATYKVAQDVEADDKLLGPFSFRQFIYLIIVAGAGFMAYVLGRLLLPLAILPLPIILFFGALALPLRKDQPMETYIAALISFYLKPRRRLWEPDGIQSLVEVTVPKTVEESRTKSLTDTEAERRLSYLADIADTRGWSIRNVNSPMLAGNTSMVSDIYNDSMHVEDMLDEQGYAARSFDTMISTADAKRRQDILNRLKQTAEPNTLQVPNPALVQTALQPQIISTPPMAPVAAPIPDPQVHLAYNPYPTSMQQSVIQPLSEQPAPQPQPVANPKTNQQPTPTPAIPTQQTVDTTSKDTVEPDIISLANNSDLSIETIAHEASRIQERHHKKPADGEVLISLR